ncbi:MAG TPA: cytochrome P460 family protein [Burkholderiales bacterium]|nr:cytochrome P460 family protein [Burkholderiales bacterium]
MKREEMKTIAFFLLAFLSTGAVAGPEKIKFPSDYLKGVLYQTLDRPDSKQYRELYAPAAAVEAVRKGQPIPHGTVLTLVQWSVEQDANGNPIKDANGRFIKKDIIAHTVMQKENGWGADYPADWPRNGEWEYAAFTADGRPNEKANANNKACFTCHLPHAKQDFVISLAKLNGTFPKAGQTLVKGAKGDVNVASFAFLPAKISAAAGKPLTFFNSDDTPHQITVTNGPRSPVFLRGQKASITIDKPGEYNYICGLHPSMKGVIEVK